MDEVRANKVRTIYVESQDRFGGKSNKELFSVLKVLQDHQTNLIDLTNERDLTSDDFIDELNALLEGMKSQKELKDTSRRSIRSRVNNFQASGSWPTGAAPFGFGKQCIKADGSVKFEWYPIRNRTYGEVWYANKEGELTLGDRDCKIPRKERTDRICLIPHSDQRIVECIKKCFELYAKHGLSYKKIGMRLNDEGFRFYDKEFTFSSVRLLIHNHACYAGHTVFGKNKNAYYNSFDGEGNIIALDNKTSEEDREAASQSITKENTHEALIDQQTWRRTKERLERAEQQQEENRYRLSPKRPEFFLKNILYCGHCGRGMTGRSDKGKPGYVCSTYNAGMTTGKKAKCGFHRITHDDAEALILGKLKEIGHDLGKTSGKKSRAKLEERISDLESEHEDKTWQTEKLIREGTEALIKYLGENYQVSKASLQKLQGRLSAMYRWGAIPHRWREDLPFEYEEIREAVREAEAEAVANVKREYQILEEKHAKKTSEWGNIANQRRKAVLEKELDEMEAELDTLSEQTKTITERLAEFKDAQRELRQSVDSLLAEYEGIDSRLKGCELESIFNSVRLYWDERWHEAEQNPSRERKTTRPGRSSFQLRTDQIQWDIRGLQRDSSW